MSAKVLDRFRLDGRTALVTGGARGLGHAIAAALASAGASVAVTSRDAEAARRVANELAHRSGGRAIGLRADVTDEASIRAAVDGAADALGGLDILVNNAGVTQRGPLTELTAAQWDEVLDTNLRGTWLCCQAVVPRMRAAGWGRIVNVSSMFSSVGLPNRSPYVASKGGVTALTRALAVELAPDGINVNAICPGPFATELADATARAHLLAAIPLGRWGNPAELGPIAVFLASDAASFVTGAAIPVDGGYTAQ